MIENLNHRLDVLNKYFHATNPDMTAKERLFSRVVKLNEEVGELCEAILSENDKNQREKKMRLLIMCWITRLYVMTAAGADGVSTSTTRRPASRAAT